MSAKKTKKRMVLIIIITTPLVVWGIQEFRIPSSSGKDNMTNSAAPRRASLKPPRIPPKKVPPLLSFSNNASTMCTSLAVGD